ncbi:MAG: YfhO family protein [Anaerolineae bacterium]|nr:YfhO family protein [Anaerolineae bacterium]
MREWMVPLALLLLAALFFWPLWIHPDSFFYPPDGRYTDLAVTHWPNALFIRYSLQSWGQVPLWRPLIMSGAPFAANPLAGLWYSPNWLLLLLPLTPAFSLLFVLHTAWAGWGGYRLVRSLGGTRSGGLVAAFTLMFAAKALAHLALGHVGLHAAWAWLPWLLWAVRRLATRRRPGDVALAGAAAAMTILADVRLGAYGGVAAAGYWLGTVCSQGAARSKARPYAVGLGAGLLAAALAAVQILPLAAVSSRLSRGAIGPEASVALSLPPARLLGLLIADHGGAHEWQTYLGAAGLLLALVGLFCWPRRQRWWWGGLALGAGLYSLGAHTVFYPALLRWLPPLGWLRGPARAWFLVVLAAAVLAGQGVSAVERGALRIGRRGGDRLAVALAGVAVAGGVGGLFLRLPLNVTAAALTWAAAGLLLALAASRRLPPRFFAVLACALCLGDLWGVGATLYRVRPAGEVLAEGGAAAAWLAEQPPPFRVYSPSYSIPQQTGALYELEMADGVDPFQLADYVAFMRVASGVDLPGYHVTIPPFPEVDPGEELLLAHRDAVPDPRLLGLLNVRYLAAAYPVDAAGWTPLGEWDGVYLYRNEYVLPRAFVVEQVATVSGLEAALAWMAQNDLSQAAVVDGGRPFDGAGESRAVDWVDRRPQRIELTAEGPGLLVLSEVYDPDWRVTVDGRAAEMVRADGILRGVYLEPGRQQVVFSYRPAGLAAGLLVTGLGVLCAAAWAIRCKSPKKRG